MTLITFIRVVVPVLALVAAVALVLLSYSPASRVRRRQRFSKHQLCQLDATYAAQFDRRSDRELRINATTLVVTGALTAAIPETLLVDQGAAVFALGPTLILSSAVASAWLAMSAAASFDAIDGPIALARSRAVTLADFIPPRQRLASWISAAFALLLALVALAVDWLGSPFDTQGTGVLVAACGCSIGVVILSEVVGSRLSCSPEPAVSAAHLYAQDAFRSSRLQSGSLLNMLTTQMLWFGCSSAVSVLSDEDLSNLWRDWVVPFGLMGIGTALLFGQAIAIRRAEKPWFRHRLWPTLEPDQILKPGDELPTRPRAHA
jgi:hypothetical protein